MDYEMEALMRSFEGTARVSCQHGMSIISLICNVARTSEILEQARPSAAALALRSPPELCLSRSLAVPALPCKVFASCRKCSCVCMRSPCTALRAGAPRFTKPCDSPCDRPWHSIIVPSDVQVFRVLGREGINVKMMSQGASKTNISLIVCDSEGQRAVRALHRQFFALKP